MISCGFPSSSNTKLPSGSISYPRLLFPLTLGINPKGSGVALSKLKLYLPI